MLRNKLNKTLHTVATLAALAGALTLLVADSAGPQCATFEGIEERFSYVTDCAAGAEGVLGISLPRLDRLPNEEDVEIVVESGEMRSEALAVHHACQEDGGHAPFVGLSLRLMFGSEESIDPEVESPTALSVSALGAPEIAVGPAGNDATGPRAPVQQLLSRDPSAVPGPAIESTSVAPTPEPAVESRPAAPSSYSCYAIDSSADWRSFRCHMEDGHGRCHLELIPVD